MKRIFLSPPHMSGRELKYIREAFDQNWIAPLGPNVDKFEDSIAQFCKVNHVAALSSGTAAIHLALILLGVTKADEVLVSTFTFAATVNPIIYQGAVPVFIDSEEKTWNMDPSVLESAIKERIKLGKKPKAIVIAHLYGMPADLESIMNISAIYDIPVIEDAAEALGSTYNGRSVGTFGRLGVFSFNGNKILNTSGGGALVSDNKELIERAKFLATQARDPAKYYQHSNIGYNYRMSNILAGIGRAQMEVLPERILQRRLNFTTYKKMLKEIDGIDFLEEPSEKYFSNHWLSTILVNPRIHSITPAKIQDKMHQREIETRPLWKPMHLQPIFRGYPKYLNGISENLFDKGICLPSGSNIKESDRKRVINILRGLLG